MASEPEFEPSIELAICPSGHIHLTTRNVMTFQGVTGPAEMDFKITREEAALLANTIYESLRILDGKGN